MAEIQQYIIDAFTDQLFSGNPAAVCILDQFFDDALLQNIAMENNLSETSFVVYNTQTGYYDIRWFTPNTEVDLCGHATLAAAYVICEYIIPVCEMVVFNSKSGLLPVRKINATQYQMDFPAVLSQPMPPDHPVILALRTALNCEIMDIQSGVDILVRVPSAEAVKQLQPDLPQLAKIETRGIIVTATGDDTDIVSRAFYPRFGINEDPVTGSAHCQLAPYWSSILKTQHIHAKQVSKRGGMLTCILVKDRVLLIGTATTYCHAVLQLKV